MSVFSMTPMSPMQAYAHDHAILLKRAAEAAGFTDPIAVEASEFKFTLIKHARKGAIVPVEGVMVRDWTQYGRSYSSQVSLGMRQYTLQGISFVVVAFVLGQFDNAIGYEFIAVDRKDYRALYRAVLKLHNDEIEGTEPPVLEDGLLDRLQRNTIDYLKPTNLKRICDLGGRPKRGVLLNGPPGNGKTSACRWLWSECIRLNLEYRTVTADAYAEARKSCGAEAQVRSLFTLDSAGVIVFDDFDVALRDRETSPDSDDQSVFLNALDGIRPTHGMVYVFTTNCPLERIDRAFRRPGRIDLVLTLEKPDAAMRKRLIERWHPDIRAGIDADRAVASTADYSFADLDEVKNQLILRHLDTNEWDWQFAIDCFAENRRDLVTGSGSFGFAAAMGRKQLVGFDA